MSEPSPEATASSEDAHGNKHKAGCMDAHDYRAPMADVEKWNPVDIHVGSLEDAKRLCEKHERALAQVRAPLVVALEAQARLTAYYNGHPNGDEPFREHTGATEQPIWKHYLCDEARVAIIGTGEKV